MANTKNISKARKKTGDPARTINRDPESVPAQLEALNVDESIAYGGRIPLDEFTQAAAKEWLDKRTRAISMAVARAKDANPGRDWTIERSVALAHTSPFALASLIITRTK